MSNHENQSKLVAKAEPSKAAKKRQRDYSKSSKVMGVSFTGNPDDGLVVNALEEQDFANLFNCDDWEQACLLVGQLNTVLTRQECDDRIPMQDLRYLMASLVRDLKPQDAVERMLVTQMVATHLAQMRTAAKLASAQQLNFMQTYEAGYNRLARTFAAQMEALRKHRHGGKQTVTVQHVNVEDGGQAIVGNVSRGGAKRDPTKTPCTQPTKPRVVPPGQSGQGIPARHQQ